MHNEVYERARLARDSRFDGLFFVGVTTTGIYCRPVCPANAPKRENVRFFPSAASAGEAGFRPCLRCRPECAPGTPAWAGTSTTVRRGLRLISNGALDNDNVEHLAERLGVTSRHLRRLFTRHVGASPLSVAHTQRLHFAKRLIDETRLPMSLISDAAGFGSVRRFNDAFRKTYGRAPRELRRVSEVPRGDDASARLTVRLAYRQPFDWTAMLGFFAGRATPGVERVDGDTYTRSVTVDGEPARIEMRPDAQAGFLALTMHGVATNSLFGVVQRARDVFDLDAPIADIGATLGGDETLAGLLRDHPGVRVPGAWDGFELMIRAVLGQQISVKAATTIAGRIAARYGERLPSADGASAVDTLFPTAERLMRARFNDIGLTTGRARTLRDVASAVVRGDVDFDVAQEPEEFCTTLKSIKGVGEWTAQYVAMRALKHPDAFPATDLGLLKAIDPPRKVTPTALLERAEGWRPWRAYAALLLWGSMAGSGG